MAQCPRCALTVPAFTRCDRCGLMLGYDGLTVLIDFEPSPAFARVRHLARRQASYSEWQEENGHRFLRVTFDSSEMDEFRRLAELAASLPGKRAFFNGLQIPWPATPRTAHFPWLAVATSGGARASHYAGK